MYENEDETTQARKDRKQRTQNITAVIVVAGTLAILLGSYFLYNDITVRELKIEGEIKINETRDYNIKAPKFSVHTLKISGELFQASLVSPAYGIKIPLREYNNEIIFNWNHVEDGMSRLVIINSDKSPLHIEGTVQSSADWNWITFDIAILGFGIIIITTRMVRVHGK